MGGAVTRRHWIVIGPTLGERKEGNREVAKERNLEVGKRRNRSEEKNNIVLSKVARIGAKRL